MELNQAGKQKDANFFTQQIRLTIHKGIYNNMESLSILHISETHQHFQN